MVKWNPTLRLLHFLAILVYMVYRLLHAALGDGMRNVTLLSTIVGLTAFGAAAEVGPREYSETCRSALADAVEVRDCYFKRSGLSNLPETADEAFAYLEHVVYHFDQWDDGKSFQRESFALKDCVFYVIHTSYFVEYSEKISQSVAVIPLADVTFEIFLGVHVRVKSGRTLDIVDFDTTDDLTTARLTEVASGTRELDGPEWSGLSAKQAEEIRFDFVRREADRATALELFSIISKDCTE